MSTLTISPSYLNSGYTYWGTQPVATYPFGYSTVIPQTVKFDFNDISYENIETILKINL